MSSRRRAVSRSQPASVAVQVECESCGIVETSAALVSVDLSMDGRHDTSVAMRFSCPECERQRSVMVSKRAAAALRAGGAMVSSATEPLPSPEAST